MTLKSNSSKLVLRSILALVSAMVFGCTGDGNSLSRQSNEHGKAELASSSPLANSTNCVEQLARFDRTQSLESLELSQLPAGLLLYSSAEVLIQSKSKPESFLIAREVPGTSGVKTQVVCSSQGDADTLNLDASIKVLTKIDLISPERNRVTVRQFQAYMNDRTRGMVSLNPRLQVRPIKTLNQFLMQSSAKTRFYKLNDGSFALQTEREDGDSKIEIIVTYEHVNRR